jgi:hypothetical protein
MFFLYFDGEKAVGCRSCGCRLVVEETALQAKTDEDRAQLESGIATLPSELKAINNQLQMP